MNVPTKDDLHDLVEEEDRASISIYLPTFRAGKEVAQNSIRFKNLLRKAEENLRETGIKPASELQKLLKPAERLLANDFFWRNQSDGLAVFLSSDEFRDYRVPMHFDELVVVASRFHIKPLLTMLAADGRFYLLALSQNDVRLFQGTHYAVTEIEPDDLGIPKSLTDITQFELSEKELQFHTGAPPRQGGRDAVYYGTGAGDYDKKDALLRYFREIDKGLQSFLAKDPAPLVLAGVDYLLPIFRQATKSSSILRDSIVGNPEELSPEELHQRAWAIVQPLFEQQIEEEASRYRELAGQASDKVSKKLETIIPAAFHGRVETLFVAVGQQCWGSFNPENVSIQEHQEQMPSDQDLLDLAAVLVLQKGGIVYALDPQRLPDSTNSAAIFRY